MDSRRAPFAGRLRYFVMMAAVIFLVAIAVRVAHIWAFRDTPLFDVLLGDAGAYDAWGQRLAGGDWVGTDVFYQAPLYPYFLGALYATVGRDLLIVRIVQALIGSASAVLLAAAAARLFSRRVAWVTGLGLALYAPAIFFDTLLQKTVLDVFFVCLALWISSRVMAGPGRPALWAGLGATLGALSLTRENALALVVVALAWATVSKSAEHKGHEDMGGPPSVEPLIRSSWSFVASFVVFVTSFVCFVSRCSPCWLALPQCCCPSSRATTR